jgi:formate hydrogenlyase subunit 6/NADH:ubiquinone oxidoreductase subunit I
MSKMALRNLFRKPVTERYPFVPKVYPAGARGKLNIEIEKCIYCGICQRRCPTAALAVSKEQKTWEVDRLRCVTCNLCVEVCPKKCLALATGYSPCCVGPQKDVFHA